MDNKTEAYQFIKQWKDENIFSFSNTGDLNTFHDSIMKKVFIQAIQKTNTNLGKPPYPFSIIYALTSSQNKKKKELIKIIKDGEKLHHYVQGH